MSELTPQVTILVIDDDPQMRKLLTLALSKAGTQVRTAGDGPEGISLYEERPVDVVLVDIRLGEMDGLEVLHRLRAGDPEATVIVMTGHGSVESAVRAMKEGAADYLLKPLDLDHLEVVLKKALDGRRQTRQLRLLEEQVVRQGSFEGLVGVNSEMQRVYEYIRRMAPSDVTVLLQGETGTGKELVARAIHNRSGRAEKPFVPINCGALSESLLESELFGHEKGAFTGAVRRKYGLIEQAEGGTLFLDEIEEMSPGLQVKLLRALQEREIYTVGGEKAIRVDFRLLAATNEELRALMEKGSFRSDLYYRISVAHLEIPPLRARREDIPLLANHFLTVHARKEKRQLEGISPEAMMSLTAYGWPGNVRELENTIQHAVLLAMSPRITLHDLPKHLVPSTLLPETRGTAELTLAQALEHCERRYLEDALAQTGGRVAEAAKIAGIFRNNFYVKMKRHGIRADRNPPPG